MADADTLFPNAHVIIDSIPYELDEGNAQDHYRRWSEPLRPANAQVVQGGDQQRFQLRPDILQFRLEDFSGGAGQYSWSPQERNRLWEIYGCDAFSNPGQIGPGMRFAPQVDDAGTPARLGTGRVVPASNDVYYVTEAGPIYKYDQSNWQWDDTGVDWTAQITVNGTYSDVVLCGGVNDLSDYIYFGYNNASDESVIERLDAGAGTWVTITDATDFAGGFRWRSSDFMLCLGDELIFSNGRGRKIYQISDSAGSTPDLLYTQGRTRPLSGYQLVSPRGATTANGRVYFYNQTQTSTLVHEIIPKNAAYIGSGKVLVELTGIAPLAMWAHLSHLYVVGVENNRRSGDDRRAFNGILMYYMDLVNGTFGTTGQADFGYRADQQARASEAVSGLFTSMWVQSEPRDLVGSATTAEGGVSVWEVNQLTGGFQSLAYMKGMNVALGEGAETVAAVESPVRFGDLLMFNIENMGASNAGLLMGLVPVDAYGGAGNGTTLTSEHWFITPWIDFGITDDKALASLSTTWDDTISSNWQVQIEAQLDDDGAAWLDLDSTDFAPDGSSTVESWVPGSNWFTTARTFSRVRFRVTFTLPSGTFDLTDAPRLTGLEAKASVSKKVRSWDLILNLTEESAWGGRRSADLIDNLIALEANDAVFPFVDLYYHEQNDIYTGLDGDSLPAPYINARLDNLQMVLDRKGQGYAMVRIVEAV